MRWVSGIANHPWTSELEKYGLKRLDDPDKAKPGDTVFMCMNHRVEVREQCKDFYRKLDEKGVKLVPSPEDCYLYDNKIGQYQLLKAWMPRTVIYYSLDAALKFAEKHFSEQSAPLISKTSEGAGSANVRKISSFEQAKAEAGKAFSEGLPVHRGAIQQGYVYWQQSAPNNGTYRVTVIGGYVFGYYRKNKPNSFQPIAPSTGPALNAEKSESHRKALEIGVQVAREIGTQWAAFDILQSDGKWYVIELSCSWPYKGVTLDAPLHDHNLRVTNKTGADMMEIGAQLTIGPVSVVVFQWNDGSRDYTPERVNQLAKLVKKHLPIRHRFVCVTDERDGFSDDVDVVKLPDEAREAAAMRTPERPNYPSSYRRLWAFSEAAKCLGERILLLDIDCIPVGDLTPLFYPDDDFVAWCPAFRWGSQERIAGGTWLLRTGTKTHVWEDFGPDAVEAARLRGFRGSDQAYLSYKLLGECRFWPQDIGILCRQDLDRNNEFRKIPDGARIVHFNGPTKPWQLTHIKWIRDAYK